MLIAANMSRAFPPCPRAASSLSLSALSDGLARSFQAWRGQSGRRYVCSVFQAGDASAMDTLQAYAHAVVLAVRRDEAGSACLVAAGDSGALPELFWLGGAMTQIARENISEFHIHLMAETQAAREAVIADLVAAQQN